MFSGFTCFLYLCIWQNIKKQSHVVWNWQYHIVWCSKYRFQVLSGVVKDLLNTISTIVWVEVMQCWRAQHSNWPHSLGGFCSTQKSICFHLEGNGKREISLQTLQKLSPIETEVLLGKSFLVSWVFFHTIGMDEDQIRRYVRYQEEQDKQEEGFRETSTLFD